MNKRPLVIEFTGLPNSGKTTLIHGLAEKLSTLGISVKVMQEDAELVPKVIPKKTWVRNTWITFGQLQSLLEVLYCTEQVVLLDRGFFDALFWAKFLNRQNVCSEEQSNSILRILHEMDDIFHFSPDYLFIIDVSIEESLRRRYSLGGEIILTNESFLNLYKNELDSFYSGLACSRWYLDTTNLSIEQTLNTTLKKIIQLISE